MIKLENINLSTVLLIFLLLNLKPAKATFIGYKSEGQKNTGSIILSQKLLDQGYGTIEEKLSYPSDSIPPLKVCAQSTSNYYLLSCLNTAAQQSSFRLKLTPGEYFIFSYKKDAFYDGGSGKRQDAIIYYANWEKNTNPISVQVFPGKISRGITPQNHRICLDRTPTPSYCIYQQSKKISSISALKSGAYILGSKQIIILKQDDNFCYVGISRNGVTVSSIYRNKQDSNVYRIYKFNTDLVQRGNNIIAFGNADYTYDSSYDLSILKYIPETRQCLKSKQPYGKLIENRFR